jgi:hypothetical protein
MITVETITKKQIKHLIWLIEQWTRIEALARGGEFNFVTELDLATEFLSKEEEIREYMFDNPYWPPVDSRGEIAGLRVGEEKTRYTPKEKNIRKRIITEKTITRKQARHLLRLLERWVKAETMSRAVLLQRKKGYRDYFGDHLDREAEIRAYLFGSEHLPEIDPKGNMSPLRPGETTNQKPIKRKKKKPLSKKGFGLG